MNNEVELEGRSRSLSAGLWTLFSWLRRDDRSSSNESLSSAGSDRSVASFAFLTPANYQPAKTPLVLPPPGPPTDTYKKRVLDRNVRRKYDCDITLHRKYGLFKSGETTFSYDAFSLPSARRISGESGSRRERERRATSECYQRPLAHVPGKRRAPLPPESINPTRSLTSSARCNSRKRRAPLPPVQSIHKNKENLIIVDVNTIFTGQMNNEKEKLGNNDVSMGCKPEKYSKKERCCKVAKVKSERCFLKQIFDSKKRNSGINTASIKLLPSISELDKEAAEIIKSCKSNASEQINHVNNDILKKSENQSVTWMCVTCLRKYNSTVTNCLYCFSKPQIVSSSRNNEDTFSISKASDNYTQTEKNSSSSMTANKCAVEEKQKLKEMLKEMKDSLPKPNKHCFTHSQNDVKTTILDVSKPATSDATETTTLRVGSINQKNVTSSTEPTTSNIIIKPTLSEVVFESRNHDSIQTASTNSPQIPELNKIRVTIANLKSRSMVNALTGPQHLTPKTVTQTQTSQQLKVKQDLHTPLKISSLLNPVYIPKNINLYKPQIQAISSVLKFKQQITDGEPLALKENASESGNNSTKPTSTCDVAGPSTSNVEKIESKSKHKIRNYSVANHATAISENVSDVIKEDKRPERLNDNKEAISHSSANGQSILNVASNPDQHSRRRDLIHQLEQSIAKGNERAAAEAAAKLAQLRLSCSVLSFSSQILAQPSTSRGDCKVGTEKSNIILTKTNVSHENKSPIIEKFSVKELAPKQSLVTNITSNIEKVNSSVTATLTHNMPCLRETNTPQKIVSQIHEIAVVDKKENRKDNYEMITIAVLVEDREATRGPVHLLLKRDALISDLRREAEASLGVATNLQRWIVGRVLCVNDNAPVATLAGPNFNAPFYLCVVESEMRDKTRAPSKTTNNLNTISQIKAGNVYMELLELEQQALVLNTENFECGVCMAEYTPGQGVVLRECVHIFCKDCLADVVRHCEEPDIACPALGCRGILQEREIRALVTPQDYERWLARGLAAAESGTRNSFHCRTRDCQGWALCEPGVKRFPCPVCKHINCVPCQAIHDGESCEQHRSKLIEAAAKSKVNATKDDDGTRTLLNSLIAKGEALECPECNAIITKKWGCDWVKCSACKTEICWVTRGRRWGPAGKGDTSGGCRCGVDGKRCHPSCGYCH